jgi:uncharacterized protein YneF (UPF0154 family)
MAIFGFLSLAIGLVACFAVYIFLTAITRIDLNEAERFDSTFIFLSIFIGIAIAILSGSFVYIFISGEYIRRDQIPECPVIQVETIPVISEVEKSNV